MNTLNNMGNYGTKGIPSKNNSPGSRYGCISWFDKTNKMLFIFGGIGIDGYNTTGMIW